MSKPKHLTWKKYYLLLTKILNNLKNTFSTYFNINIYSDNFEEILEFIFDLIAIMNQDDQDGLSEKHTANIFYLYDDLM